mmetsp:Transcript_45440/g.176713  ORF Transcript_45440/g.176713 Transcript_45440/m.176713 type:complete len:298 (-) Transcript_45440:1660-2553(-)
MYGFVGNSNGVGVWKSSNGSRMVCSRRPYRGMLQVRMAAEGGGEISFSNVEIEYYRPRVDDIRLDDEREKVEQGTVRELPLFPLGIVLNPGANTPLHIFEMRYRLLFNRIQEKDNMFGLIFYNKENNLVARVGCAALVTQYNPLDDGRLLVDNNGTKRFRVLRYLEEKPYIKAMVEFYDDEEPTEDISEVELNVWSKLQDVLRLSNKLYDKRQEFGERMTKVAPGDAEQDVEQADRRKKFSFSVNQMLDMTVLDQQLLLQTRSTSMRLKKQDSILDGARQYLAAQVTIKEALGKDKK